ERDRAHTAFHRGDLRLECAGRGVALAAVRITRCASLEYRREIASVLVAVRHRDVQRLLLGAVLDRLRAVPVQDRRGESALAFVSHDRAFANKKPVWRRQTGFVCSATDLVAGANLALAAFVKRPQAEASNRRTTNIQANPAKINAARAWGRARRA